jgi:hypothetical protein
MKDDDHDTDRIADAIEATLVGLRLAGMPPDVILGTALATVLSLTVTTFGGKIAAQAARSAAGRVEAYPCHQDPPLARMTPMGRA